MSQQWCTTKLWSYTTRYAFISVNLRFLARYSNEVYWPTSQAPLRTMSLLEILQANKERSAVDIHVFFFWNERSWAWQKQPPSAYILVSTVLLIHIETDTRPRGFSKDRGKVATQLLYVRVSYLFSLYLLTAITVTYAPSYGTVLSSIPPGALRMNWTPGELFALARTQLDVRPSLSLSKVLRVAVGIDTHAIYRVITFQTHI